MLVPAEEDQRETKCIIKVNDEDYFYIGVEQIRRRIVVHIAASPTRTSFLKRWALLMTEVAKLNIDKDAPIDLIYDYTDAKPVPPNLKVIMFTKALKAGTLFPNLQTWRVVPGGPSKNAFLQKFSREMSSSWLPLRKNEKVFQSVEEAEGYLDELRPRGPKKYHWEPRRMLAQMRKDRSKVESFVLRWGKKDFAEWKDRTVKSLTYAQLRIGHLRKAYMAREITTTELKRELLRILNVRDREKRSMDS
jgi:hypothetical protein